jgi:hypothetical protein
MRRKPLELKLTIKARHGTNQEKRKIPETKFSSQPIYRVFQKKENEKFNLEVKTDPPA